jgi:hypothetical protein
MNIQPYEKPPRWWSPKPSPFWISFWRRSRRRIQLHKQRLIEIEIQGLDHVRQLLDDGCGVLITPNHASHADCYSIYEVADRLGIPFYVMIAWQNFVRDGAFRAMVLRQHGGFSVDREGNDLAAFRQAVNVLKKGEYPLVVFPEGDVYHLNDRILPFREGPAAMALSAAKRGDRPIAIVPCGIKYQYVEDPRAELLEVMSRLEQSIHWKPRIDLSLSDRIYRLAEGAVSLKEIEFCGTSSTGPLPQRLRSLINFILARLENGYHLESNDANVAERVKLLRQNVIQRAAECHPESVERKKCDRDLADLFFTIQLMSYPGDYVSETPSIERIAETIDKLEEDVLGAGTAAIRGARKASVTLGQPIPVSARRKERKSAAELTRLLEASVQGLLNEQAPEWHQRVAATGS